jgi:hypothetical protein
MTSKEKALREALRTAIKALIIQEVRVLQLEQARSPAFIIDEMARSIQEAKRQVIDLVRFMPTQERNALIKKLIRQSVDEEIDRSIQVRKNRCLRCIHVRYLDEVGSPHVNLPIGTGRARVIGCEVITSTSGVQCLHFTESPTATSIEDYLSEISFFYEVKEMFDQFNEIWDCLTK